jgi:hypothetical protein
MIFLPSDYFFHIFPNFLSCRDQNIQLQHRLNHLEVDFHMRLTANDLFVFSLYFSVCPNVEHIIFVFLPIWSQFLSMWLTVWHAAIFSTLTLSAALLSTLNLPVSSLNFHPSLSAIPFNFNPSCLFFQL